jgi:hypothetical protein
VAGAKSFIWATQYKTKKGSPKAIPFYSTNAYFYPRRVRPPFRPAFFFVRTAFIADRCRALRPRRCAADLACRDRLSCDAADLPSLRCHRVARERTLEGFPPAALHPFAMSRRACARVFADAPFEPANATPARLAFESPMAIACCGDRAPCFPPECAPSLRG